MSYNDINNNNIYIMINVKVYLIYDVSFLFHICEKGLLKCDFLVLFGRSEHRYRRSMNRCASETAVDLTAVS